jgi:N-acetylmuramoyl-L-alanine amidase
MHSYYANQEVARHHYAELRREGAQARLARKNDEDEQPATRVRWARKRLAHLRPALSRSV